MQNMFGYLINEQYMLDVFTRCSHYNILGVTINHSWILLQQMQNISARTKSWVNAMKALSSTSFGYSRILNCVVQTICLSHSFLCQPCLEYRLGSVSHAGVAENADVCSARSNWLYQIDSHGPPAY